MSNSFRTEYTVKKGSLPEISYHSKLFLVGSCFSDAMSHRLCQARFVSMSNPFGTTYNPHSMEVQLRRIAQRNYFSDTEFREHEGRFFHYDLHSSLSGTSLPDVVRSANERLDAAAGFLKDVSVMVLTAGTAWVHVLRSNNTIVNNCHKQPASLFTRKLLSRKETEAAFTGIIGAGRSANPKMQVVFTLSPVRHLRDGFEENSLSKALLRTAIDDIVRQEACSYFPAYELVMDDLRDYRFYKPDMIHPNDVAIEYVWNAWATASMSEETLQKMKQLEELRRSLSHRPFQPNSKAHRHFLLGLRTTIQQLISDGVADLQEELKSVEKQLSAE